jgi:hypothetical protein
MPTANKIHYGWIVVGITCLVLLTSAGIRSTPGILMVPLEQEFHWSRATIALAVSINLILYGCIGPFAAAVMERFGIRRSVLCALIVVGVASHPLMQTLATHPDVGISCRLRHRLSATVLSANRGALVHGAARPRHRHPVGGASTGQLCFTGDGQHHRGYWRARPRSPPWLRHPSAGGADLARPAADVGLMPYGETGEPKPARDEGIRSLAFGALRRRALRDFWLLAGTYFVCGASTNGLIGTHLIPACIDHGFPRSPARRSSPPWACSISSAPRAPAGSPTSSTIAGCCSPITRCAGCR